MIWLLLLCMYSSISELDIVEIGHVEFLPQVLPPCRVYDQLVISHWHFEHHIKWLRTPQRLAVMESSVSSSHSLNVFTIPQQHLVILLNFIGVVSPLIQGSEPGHEDEERDTFTHISTLEAN